MASTRDILQGQEDAVLYAIIADEDEYVGRIVLSLRDRLMRVITRLQNKGLVSVDRRGSGRTAAIIVTPIG